MNKIKEFLNKVNIKIQQVLQWVANKYVQLPLWARIIVFVLLVAPGVGAFLGIWFALGKVMDEGSFLRWLLAAIPAMSMIVGLMIGMSYLAGKPIIKDEVKTED